MINRGIKCAGDLKSFYDTPRNLSKTVWMLNDNSTIYHHQTRVMCTRKATVILLNFMTVHPRIPLGRQNMDGLMTFEIDINVSGNLWITEERMPCQIIKAATVR